MWLLQGALDLARNQAEEAESAYRQALTLSEQNPLARLGLARALLAQQDLDAAEEQLVIINKQFPNNPSSNFLLGALEVQRGNREKAKDALLQVVKVDPGHLQALMTLASIYYEDGQLQQAESHINLFRVVVPDYLPAQKLAAAIELRLGNPAKSVEVLEAVMDQASNDPQYYALLGSAYMANGEADKGIDYLSQAAELAPEEASIKTQLAMGRLSTGATEEAIEELEAAVELDSDLMRADILLTSIHLRQQEFDKALVTAQQAAEKDPDNPVYHNLMGAAYVGQQDFDAATIQFNQALAIEPEFTPALTNLAMLDYQQGNYDEAKERLEAVLQFNENNVQALVGLARIAESNEDIRTTARHLEKARLGNSYALEPRIMLVNYYLLTNDIDKALVIAREARDIAPERIQVLTLLGQVESTAGNYATAVEIFSKVVSALPESAEAHYRLGVAQSQNNKADDARRSLQRSLQLEPDNLLVMSALTSLELRQGDHDAALEMAKLIQEKHPDSAEGIALQGDILLAQGKPEEGIKAYEQAFLLQQTSLLAIKLHQARLANGNREDAFAGLETWSTMHPEDISAKIVLAGSHMQEGNRNNAILLYEESLRINPDNTVALNNLAWLYHQAGNIRAIELAQRAYDINPDLINVVDTFAWILIEQGQVERGLTLLRGAVNDDVTDLTIHYHYAAGLSKSGDKLKARAELERILADNSQFAERQDAEQLLKSLRQGN